MSTQAIQTRLWAREEYERLVALGLFHPEERLELVEGEIVRMTPQGSNHATAISLVENTLRAAFGSGFVVRVQMPLAFDPDSEPEPDLAVVVGAPRDYKNAHPQTAVLVVEVADATLAYDRERKAELYARAGIPEYWILNLVDRQLEAHRGPITAGQSFRYQDVRTISVSQSIAPLAFLHATITVTDLLP